MRRRLYPVWNRTAGTRAARLLALSLAVAACGSDAGTDAGSVFTDVTAAAATLTAESGVLEVMLARIPAAAVPDTGVVVWLGRFIEDVDYEPGARPVLVISHALWQRLGEDPTLIGTMFDVDGSSRVLIGVAAPGWEEPPGTTAWVPR